MLRSNMTAILSLLCSDHLVSCHTRRETLTSEHDYLLDTDSWDLCGESTSSKDCKNSRECLLRSSPALCRCQSRDDLRKVRSLRLRRFMSRVSNALNPKKWSRESSEDKGSSSTLSTLPNEEPTVHVHHSQRQGPSRAVSFASRPSASYHILNRDEEGSDEEYEVRHFAIVDIVPGKQPRWISDATRRDNWRDPCQLQTRSFDASLQRRRSLSATRNTKLHRRAYSLNRVSEWDAMARRSEFNRRNGKKRPESSFVGNPSNLYKERPTFYYNDDDGEVESNDLETLPWDHPARLLVRKYRSDFEQFVPPRPPKPWRLQRRESESPQRNFYVNDVVAPPRPPKPARHSFHEHRSATTLCATQRILRRQRCTQEPEEPLNARIQPI